MCTHNKALSALDNIKAFKGCAVKSGVVVVTDQNLISHLNDVYGEVNVCGFVVAAGEALKSSNAGEFEKAKSDHQQALQYELGAQLALGNDVDIDYK